MYSLEFPHNIVTYKHRPSRVGDSVGVSPDSDSDSMGESKSESGLESGLGLWSYGLGLGLGLHPGGLGLTVSPCESGEKCTRQILTFMCNNGRNKGKELIKLLI